MDSFRMDLTRISHSCGFVRIGPPTISTVIDLVNGLLFSLGAVGKRYMDAALLSAKPESLLLSSIFVVGFADFE